MGMFKFEKLISFVVLASLIGAVLAPIAGMVADPRSPKTLNFMLGLVAASGFLIALALAMGVLVSAAKPTKD